MKDKMIKEEALGQIYEKDESVKVKELSTTTMKDIKAKEGMKAVIKTKPGY